MNTPNIIEQAAALDYQVAAMGLVMKAMGIQHSYAHDKMPELPQWRKMDATARQIALGEWIKAEAYAKADMLAHSSLGIDPNDSVGTRD